MTEKHILLEHTALHELLGAENLHMKKIAAAFPTSKLTARREDILITGPDAEVTRIHTLLKVLIAHCNQQGALHESDLQAYLSQSHTNEPILMLENNREDVIIHATGGRQITPQSKQQHVFWKIAKKHDLVFATGPAGTGKTFLAVAIALHALRNKEVRRIVIARPAVETGESLGFLPGDLKEKMDPYLQPVYDALRDILSEEKLRFFKEKGIIEICPLAYMRGRTLNKAFILLDEAQNATTMQLKMFLTRLGTQAKAIIVGDISQIDLPSSKQSGLIQTMHCLKTVPGIGFVELQANDIMRHPLVKRIIEAYDA